MRPYLALIKDSFRAVIASSVLYVLLALITVILLLVAPLHVREVLDWKLFFGRNVLKPDDLIERLVESGPDAEQPSIHRVWGLLSDDLKTGLVEMVADSKTESESSGSGQDFMRHHKTRGQLQDELNEIIKNRDLYEPEAWASKRMNAEAKELLAVGVDKLTDERVRRLNRLLLASATGRLVQPGSGNALELWYGPWRFEEMTMNISHSEFMRTTLTTITYVIDKFVLSIGLFIAILVTANFIPETFLPGSLNLLLSKPISRWGLLLAKFVGGCAFVSLCSVYLFLGLWLWLGLAMGIWDRGILWAIPLYIVVFAIYYSVSTWVGVLSNSPILSVIVTAIFWAACFLVGITHQITEGRINNSRTRDLIAADDQLLQIGELNSVFRWDDQASSWQKQLEFKMGDEHRIAMGAVMFVPGASEDSDLATLGPVVDVPRNRVVAGTLDLISGPSPDTQLLYVADIKTAQFTEIGKFPRGTLQLLAGARGVVIISRNGEFFRLDNSLQPLPTNDAATPKGDANSVEQKPAGALGSLAKSLIPSKSNSPFQPVGPDRKIVVTHKSHLTLNSLANDDIFVYHQASITRFRVDDQGMYRMENKTSLDEDWNPDDDTIINSSGKYLVVALSNSTIVLFDATSLKLIHTIQPAIKSPFRSVQASPDGQYFVFRLRDKTAWLLDTKKPDGIHKIPVAIQGDVLAATFDNQNRLWLATHANRARQYDLAGWKQIKTISPPTSWWVKAFEYVVAPLYKVFPKPGEFYKLVEYLSTNPKRTSTENTNLNQIAETTNPWQPLWSGLYFMVFMLSLTCLIFHFRDY